MTDKEQIICHGVDVSKCDRLNLNSAYGWDDPDMCSIPCCNNAPNCLFKQLARVNEELQLAEQLINGILKTLNLEAYDYKADQNEILTEIRAFKQECEQKDKEIKGLHLIIDRLLEASGYDKHISSAEDFEDVYKDMDYKLGLIDELKQECKELKAYARRQENQREEYYKEYLKKDKALEEIESICLEDAYTFADGTVLRYDSLDEILDIINKAKEE